MQQIRVYQKAMVLMTVALAIGFVLSCASSSPSMLPNDQTASKWDATVDENIHDAKRADKLKQLGRQLDEMQKSLSSDIDALKEKFTTLNADYASTKDEMRQLVNGFEPKRRVALAQYRDIIFAMRQEVSAEEWKAMID